MVKTSRDSFLKVKEIEDDLEAISVLGDVGLSSTEVSDSLLKIRGIESTANEIDDTVEAVQNGLAGIAYVHPASGVTPGTYKSVTVDINGHVTSGTNPTTIEDFGITNVYNKTNTDNLLLNKVDKNADIVPGSGTKINYDSKGLVTGSELLSQSDIPNLDTNKIITGVLPITRGGTGSSTASGTGSVVLVVSPTLVTPNIGIATGTSFNGITGLSNDSPQNPGTASAGTSSSTSRADHVHPAQTNITGNAGTVSGTNDSILSSLGTNINDTSDEIILAYMSTSANQTVYSTLSVKEY